MEWYVGVLKKYADFSGRARRMEYWMYFLFNVVIVFGMLFLDGALGLRKAGDSFSPLYTLYALATLVPGLAVSIRRMHDTNKSALWILIVFIPLIGGLILLLFLVKPGDVGKNQYGPDPIGAKPGRDEHGE